MTAPTPAGSDKTTLWGVLGIIFALCCLPAGIIFAILSLNESKKHNNSPTLAYVAFAICGLSVIFNIIGFSSGWYF